MSTAEIVLTVCVGVFTGVAALWDWRAKRLPNSLTVSAFVLGMVFHTTRGGIEGGFTGALSGTLFALAGFAAGFGILFVLWVIAAGGGGDVKLMGALGAWLGWKLTIYVFLASAGLVLVCGIVVLLLSFSRRGLGGVNRKASSGKGQRRAGRAGSASGWGRLRMVPFGLPVCVATWCLLAVVVFQHSLGQFLRW